MLCACDAGVLFAIEAISGRVLGDIPLSGTPDVIFMHSKFGRLYVAVGDPGVIDVIDIGSMRRVEALTSGERAKAPLRSSPAGFWPAAGDVSRGP